MAMDAYNKLREILIGRGAIDKLTPCDTKEELIMLALAYIIEEIV